MRSPTAPPTIEIEFPDLSRWERGNAGIPYVWRFESKRAGPRITIQGLTHGNEVCGAIALAQLLEATFRPVRGTLTLIFANVDAYLAFDAADPFASRCLDEDLNRLWTPDVLDGPRQSSELTRARTLRPCYEATDFLLDLHSMTDPCPPLGLAANGKVSSLHTASRCPSTSSSTRGTRPAGACAIMLFSTIRSIRAARC